MNKSFLFRTDASPAIGTGHVMRCLALAQVLRDEGGKPTFLSSVLSETVSERLTQEQCAIHSLKKPAYGKEDALETAQCARNIGADWIIVDGYSFDPAYQEHVKAQGLKVLLIDDLGHWENYTADIILNQNIFAKQHMYKNVGTSTSLLLGTQYTLLRKEFWQWQTWTRNVPEQAKRILVTLGGYDPHNAISTVIDALKNIREPIAITILFGKDDPYIPEVRERIQHALVPFRLESNVANMPKFMAEADIAISAGGTTCYELAFMQLPTMTMVLADNQKMLADAIEDAGLSINLGNYETLERAILTKKITELLLNKRQRSHMATVGRNCVDGQGASRVCMRLTGAPLRLRPANVDDAKLLWEWANDPVVRASAFSTDPIPWEKHVAWFAQKIRDPRCFIFVAIDADENLIGQVRFDITGDEDAECDVHIARESRGKKYAAPLIDAGVRKLFASTDVRSVSAYIREENEASIRSFKKAGFSLQGKAYVHTRP